MAYMRLGELLVASKAVTKEQLDASLESQKISGRRLGDELIENGIITENQLIDLLQMQLGIEFIDLTAISVPVELTKYVPFSIANKHTVVPVKLVNNELYIAMSDPLNFVCREDIKTASKKKVVPMIATRRAIEHIISTLYGSEGAVRAIEEMKLQAGITTSEIIPVQMAETVDANSGNAPTIRFVNSVIERAIKERASDIHLEPQEGEMIVRMRIDGLLRRVFTVPAELQASVISRLKVMGNMNISEHKIPQDGNAMVTESGHSIDLRISTIPTVFGEKAVLRLLDKSAGAMTKEEIGLSGRDLEKYDALLTNSSGVILLVGPTGSGKSTTMSAMLRQLASEEVNIETLEDPVEYHIPGITQCQINNSTGMTFATGLRSILRQDPDIIAVGKIRDGETANIALRAAITGHLVLSTLHTNDTVSAVQRLENIGVEPYLLAGAVKGVISQRLVRKICPHCAKPYTPDASERKFLGISPDEDVSFYRGEGCPECFHTGYRGRQAVFEILTVNAKLRNLISENATYDRLLEAAAEGDFVPMKENCKRLVLDGVTTADEAVKAINSTVD